MIRRTPSTATLLASSFASVLAIAVLPACDDSGEQRKDGAPGTPDAKAPDGKTDSKSPTPSITKFKSPAEAIGAYNKCYSDCFTAHTNATNRETCKLDCDSLAETGMDTLKDDAAKTTYQTTWKTLRGCITGQPAAWACARKRASGRTATGWRTACSSGRSLAESE